MNIEDLKTLVELVSERDIAELELEDSGVKLKIRKASQGAALIPAAGLAGAPGSPSRQDGSSAGPVTTPGSAGADPEGAPAGAVDDGLHYVKSPMVGTFYRQPEPGAEPFAREGDTVKKGQVLCIIEAMKLMNEIESELHGELVKVLVENGQSVQYGDALFAIRES